MAVAAPGCSGSQPASPGSTSTTRAVPRETVQVTTRTVVASIKLTGSVEPVPAVTVVAPAPGRLRLAALRPLIGADVGAGQPLAMVEMACEQATADAAAVDPGTPAPASTCQGKRVALDAPTGGRLALEARVVRALARGDTTLDVSDGDELATIDPGGWRLRLPLDDDDQPARFADAPPLAYAVLPDTAEPVFQAAYVGLDYGDDGSTAVIARPVDPPPLVRGAKVTVSFVTDRREQVPVLPRSAVRSTGNAGQVLVLVDGETEPKPVIVGANDGSWIEVHGLADTDRVVRYPLDGELSDP